PARLQQVAGGLRQEVVVRDDGLLEGALDEVEPTAQLGLERLVGDPEAGNVGAVHPHRSYPRPTRRDSAAPETVTTGAPTPGSGSGTRCRGRRRTAASPLRRWRGPPRGRRSHG